METFLLNGEPASRAQLPVILEELSGENVSAFIGVGPRNTYEVPSMCVNGTLEIGRANQTNPYRVLTGNSYTYFHANCVTAIALHPERFKDGSKAVITLNI